MASHNNEGLERVIQHYGEVAEVVNHREMKRFIEEIRQRWNPLPHEEEYRFPGWTDEGAFTRCIYTQAFHGHDWPKLDRDGADVCQAEEEEQVQFYPTLDEIMNYVPKPLAAPLLQGQISEMLNRQNETLQQQVKAAGFSATQAATVQLPADVKALYSITNGIRGAGVPTETVYTLLVYPYFTRNGVSGISARPEMPREVRIRVKDHQELWRETPIAAWQFGGCEQHRSIFYVLCLSEGSTEIASARWQIWDRIDIEVEKYGDLTELLAHETEHIETEEGGAMQRLVVMHERYPV